MTRSSPETASLLERVAKAIRESEAYWWNRSDEPEDGLAETLARAAIEAFGAAQTEQERIAEIQYEAGMYKSLYENAIERCALVAEGFDAACNSPRMKLFEEAGLVIAVYKRDGEIGAAIRALADTSTVGNSK